MISIRCSFSVPLGRFYDTDYIRPLDISVISYDSTGNEIVLGKIAGDQLLLLDAEIDEEDLYDICDQDSHGMYDLYTALFEKGREFHPELEINEVTSHILFLWRSSFHPKLAQYEQAILEIVCSLLGSECVAIMWRDVSSLSDKHLSDLGFSKIANSSFVFRHVSFLTHHNKLHPKGIKVDMDFEATKQDEELMMDHWNKAE